MFQHFVIIVCILEGSVLCLKPLDRTHDYITCNNDVAKLGNTCYRFPPPLLAWKRAKSGCISVHGKLVQPETREENERLKFYLAKSFPGRKFWIGIRERSDTGVFHFLVGNQNMTYTDWVMSTPPHKEKRKKCVFYDGRNKFKWMNSICHTRTRCICELNACPPACRNDVKPVPTLQTTKVTHKAVTEAIKWLMPLTTASMVPAVSPMANTSYQSEKTPENSTDTTETTTPSEDGGKSTSFLVVSTSMTTTTPRKTPSGNGSIRATHIHSDAETCAGSRLLQIMTIAAASVNCIIL